VATAGVAAAFAAHGFVQLGRRYVHSKKVEAAAREAEAPTVKKSAAEEKGEQS
jgi:hypothetical protein